MHGFAIRGGMMGRHNQVIQMDPLLLELQRERVQEIRTSLPRFDYDKKDDLITNDSTKREFR